MEAKDNFDDIFTKCCNSNLEETDRNTLSSHGSCAGPVIEEEFDNVEVPFTPNSHRDSVEKTLNCVNKDKSYGCDVCMKYFSRKSHLTRHSYNHAVEQPFKCDICSKSYFHNSHLITHSNTHTGEKPFKCDICSKSFFQKSHLTQHTGGKPFEFSLCSKSFSIKSYLTTHLYSHSGVKPFQCSICSNYSLSSQI